MFCEIGGVQHIHTADHFVHRRKSHFGHELADFLRDKEEEVDQVLRAALKFAAQPRVLRGNADGTGVHVTFARHNAAEGDQRRRRESEFFGAQQGGDHHIAAGLQLSIGLQPDAAAQIVEHDNLLGLGPAKFPGNARVLDRCQRGSPGAAVMSADQDDVRVRLGDPGSDDAHANFGHQLHGNPGPGIHIFQIVNQLGQVFDRVDVVMRGGEIRGTPGVECRTRAMTASTL